MSSPCTNEDRLDSATVAVVAHGLLNNLAVVALAAYRLSADHPDRQLADRMEHVLHTQVAAMTDSLRLLTLGLPRDVVAALDTIEPAEVQLWITRHA